MRLLRTERPSNVVLLIAALLGLCHTSVASCASNNQALIQNIPSCALACVEQFINTQYPTGSCCGGNDIDCLCRTNTTGGLTLGEGSLACAIGSCPAIVASNSNVFGICLTVSGALPQTHGTITATVFAVSTEIFTSTQVSATPTSATARVTGTSVALSRPSGSSVTASDTAVTTRATSDPQSVPLARATSSPTPSSSALSSPAVVGLSVASGVSAVFLIGVLLFFCGRKLRRRKLNAENKEEFEIGGDMREPPNFTTIRPMLPLPTPGDNSRREDSRPRFQNFPLQPLNRSGPLVVITKPQNSPPGLSKEAIGIALSPETDYDGSPQSQSSQRTLSQLLPDKPSYGLYPEPLRVSRQGPRPASDATIFEDDVERPARDLFRPPFEAEYYHSAAGHERGDAQPPYPGTLSNPRALMYAAERVRNPNPNAVPASHAEEPMSTGARPDLPPIHQRYDANLGRTGLAYPGSSYDHDTPSQGSHRPNSGNNRRSLGRNFSRLTLCRRSNSRNSRTSEASDTSFETIEVEDDIGPSLPKQLSPIKETTVDKFQAPGRSPVKYPKLPRSASVSQDAEVIPAPRAARLYDSKTNRVAPETAADNTRGRPAFQGLTNIPLFLTDSSSSRSRSSSPSSGLLAKRRGERVADKMEAQFRSGTQARNEQGRPKWSVVNAAALGSDGKPTTNANLPRTPPGGVPPGSGKRHDGEQAPREHNITPSRRGGDLFLNVD